MNYFYEKIKRRLLKRFLCDKGWHKIPIYYDQKTRRRKIFNQCEICGKKISEYMK